MPIFQTFLPGAESLHLVESLKPPKLRQNAFAGIHVLSFFHLLTSNTTTRFSTDKGAKAQITIPRSRIRCPRYEPALIRQKCRSEACQSPAQFYSTFSNTTTSLPYIIHLCCKQKAGKLSKQNNFLPEDKPLRTSA